ncbi:hypothetical protein ACHWQZ_G012275 [Mnemiopsis leidyi]
MNESALPEKLRLCIAKTSTLSQEAPNMAPWLILIASGHGFLGIQSLVCNGVVFGYYASKFRELVPFMYLSLASCDIITGLTALLNALILTLIVLLKDRLSEETVESVLTITITIYCGMIMFSARVSVAYNVIVAVVRTKSLTRPFSRQRLLYVVIWIVLLPLCLAPLVGFQIKYFLDNDMIDYMLFTPYLGAKWLGWIGLQLNILLPFLLPSILAVVCMTIQGYTLIKTRGLQVHRTSRQRDVTKTIVLLTFLFFVCNTAFAISFYVDMFTYFVTCLPPDQRFLVGCVVTGSLTMINAAFNPIIMISRGSKLRAYAFGERGGKNFQRMVRLNSDSTRSKASGLSSTYQ